MTSGQAITYGLRATRRAAWMVVLFFACNLLLAGAVAGPMYTAINDHVGHSLVARELVRGFSAPWLVEFQLSNAAFLKAFSRAVMYAGILFLALNTILSAGAYEVFARGEGARMHAFGRGLGKYFGRFARLAAVASLFYFVVFWFWQGPVAKLIQRTFENSIYERGSLYLSWLRWALLFASAFVVSVVLEYAKADVVVHEHPSALAALGHGAGFVLARLGRVMLIYVALGTLTTVTMLAYAMFARFFPQHSVLTILIWFVMAQALLALRWGFRLASWAAAVGYYGAHAPTTDRAAATGEPAVAPAPAAMP